MAKLEQLLQRGEKVRRTTGVHPAGLVWALLKRAAQLLAVYLIARVVGLPWLAWFASIDGVNELGLIERLAPIPGWLTSICAGLAALVGLLAGLDVLRWRATQFVLTDRRVLQFYGVVSRLVVDTPLDTISEMALRQHLVAERLDYGDLLLRTGALEGCHPMEFIAALVTFRNSVERARLAIVDRPRERPVETSVIPASAP